MKIAIVVTGRSDAGILQPLIDELRNRGNIVWPTPLELQNEGPYVSAHEQVQVQSILLEEYRWEYEKNQPDKVVLLGDRSETMAAALAAYGLGIPIVHLQGGEHTYGSLDEGYRWAISQLATYHCAATKQAFGELDEQFDDVYCTGALGCHDLDKVVAEPKYDYVFLYNPHKATVDPRDYVDVLSRYGTVLWVGPNADAGRGLVWSRINDLPKGVSTVLTLDRASFLAIVKGSMALVGNSSAGIIEAPSLGVRSIDIGNRQDGRERAQSVFRCTDTTEGLDIKLQEWPYCECQDSDFTNPYYKPNALQEICRVCEI